MTEEANLANVVWLIALLIFVVPMVFVVMTVNDDKVKKDAKDYAEREAERKALKQTQEFDKF